MRHIEYNYRTIVERINGRFNMGKLEVRGNASKTVDYDLMKIELDFHPALP